MEDFTSIVLVTFRKGEREAISKRCLLSILENTDYPFELILVDNTQVNQLLGEVRNLGISLSHGKYLVITDDDIEFKKGWLSECIKMVEMGDKFMATPIQQSKIGRWEKEPVNGYRQNFRTGSNCMVGRKSDFEKIGPFPCNKCFSTVGKFYANAIARAGYSFLITKEPLATDLGLKIHSYIGQTHP